MSKADPLRPYESVPLGSLNIEKAGFVIYGRNSQGQLCVLTTYTQGRFDDSANKFYGLAKGAIDPGESPIEAACRETHEETGIDIAGILGPKNLHKLVTQRDVVPKQGDMPPNEYGVTVKRAYSQPSDFAYMSASGHFRRLQTFFVEVDNIDALDLQVKMPPASESEKQRLQRVPEAERFTSEAPDLEYTVAQHLQKYNYPDLEDMLGILRSGKLGPSEKHNTRRPWVPLEETTIIGNPQFREFEQRWIKENHRKIDHITTQEEWLDFCRDTEREHKHDYKKLEKDFGAVKGYLNSTGICGDKTFIKMDEKDRPLNFFFEGGEVIPLSKFLTRAAQLAETNKTYRDATWGEYQGDAVDPRTGEQIAFAAQIGGILPRDGQDLSFSKIYSTEAARSDLHTLASHNRWANRHNAAIRIDRLATVLDHEAVAR